MFRGSPSLVGRAEGKLSDKLKLLWRFKTKESVRSSAAIGGGKVYAIFQPHRFSRTESLQQEFGSAFEDADHVWVLDIYAAGEDPIAGINGETIVARAKAHGSEHVAYAADPQDAVRDAVERAQPGDVLLVLGAGDVWQLADVALEHLRKQEAVAGEGR